LHLLIIGHCEERERQYLVALADQLKVESQLKWCPHVSDVDTAFAQVEILVVPSIRQESFGRVAVEAMARGIPVVASDCGGLPEVIEDGVSGLIVPSGNPEYLAYALDHVLCDLRLRQRFAIEGMKRFSTLFSASRMAREYARLLHEG
jgi:glycosyltransferase involved in cell wall biosynthesis